MSLKYSNLSLSSTDCSSEINLLDLSLFGIRRETTAAIRPGCGLFSIEKSHADKNKTFIIVLYALINKNPILKKKTRDD